MPILGRKATYPWDRWLNRKKSIVIQPEQYSATIKSMCVMIRQQSRLRNVSVSVFPRKDGSIRIVPKGPRV
jgi:hypothetical protein